MPEDVRLFLKKFIDFGFLQTSNLSDSPHPEKLAFFLHKSVQEYLSASFLVRDLKNAKESFNSLSKIDSFKRFTELFEVFKFVFELSSEATVAVFRHLKMIGDNEGLTGYNFCENPFVEELTENQREFYDFSLDLFLSCPASERQAVYSSFLQSVNGVIIMDPRKHLPTVARELCLTSTSSLKPDYVFFAKRYSGFVDRFGYQDMRDRVLSVMSDVDTVAVTCYGEVKSVNWNDLRPDEFFFEKVGHRLVFCLIRPELTHLTNLKFIEQLRSLISAPESSLQESDHVSQNHDVCNSLHSTEKTSDKTLTHSLSYLREIAIGGKIECPTNELVILLNSLHHVPRLSELFLYDVGMGNQECQLLATALKYVGKLSSLRLSNNPLGHGISELAKHLHSVPHLKMLNLRDTQMGEEEVTALAHSLQNVTQLSELVLSKNSLGHGISELSKHLHNVPHLKGLSLSDTLMGEEEVTALAHVLVHVPELRDLFLNRNPLGRGVTELINCLRSGPQLWFLFLMKVQLTKKEATELCTLAKERNLRSLVTDYNTEVDDMRYEYRLLTEAELQEKRVTFDEE